MVHYLIGLDCGGTRTRGVLANEEMRVLARVTGGPGNPLSAGMRLASRSYGIVIRKLLHKAARRPSDISALGIGAAGAGRKAERLSIARSLRRFLPDAKIAVDTDGMIALLGATHGEPGIIVIAGTGSFVLGVDRNGKTLRGGGWGPLLGDEGGGATLGREAIQAMLRAEDGREPATRLRKAILARYKVRTLDELVSRIYRRPPSAREFAKLWPALLRVAEKGDPVARAILRKGGEELARTVEAVSKRLDFKDSSIPLILAGGVLSQQSLLRQTLLGRLKRFLPNARLITASAAPEIGALHLALRAVREDSRIRRG